MTNESDINTAVLTDSCNYLYRVQWCALMPGLVGASAFESSKDRRASVELVQGVWRRWLYRVLKDNRSRVRSRLSISRAYACPSPFIVSPTTPVCGFERVCPWCYIRRVGVDYDRFANLWSPGLYLTIFENKRIVPSDYTPEQLYFIARADTMLRRGLTTSFRDVGCTAGVSTYVVEPLRDGSWIIRIGVMALSVVHPELPSTDLFTSPRSKVRVRQLQFKKDLIGPLITARKYPAGLLKGKTEMIIPAINALYDLKGAQLFGSFRKSSKGVVEVDNSE